MNISNDPTNGRILVHGKGTGGISRADVERRARELADIDGRSGASITDDDIARARADLRGSLLPDAPTEDSDGDAGATRDPSEPLSVSGTETLAREGPDEQKAVERLALEGVDEAQHDQMLASRRHERRVDKQGGA
jgi:hypothetical protein